MRVRLRHLLPALSLAAAASLAACGDNDPTGVQGDPLSQSEVQAVFATLTGAFSSLGSPSASPVMDGVVPQPSAAPVDVAETFDLSIPCAVSGSMAAVGSLSGVVDDETFDTDVSYALTITPAGCTVSSQETTVVVDGDPSITIMMDMVFDETSFLIDGSYRGGLAYTTNDGRAGSCGINLNFTISANPSTGASEQSVTGKVCGVSGNQFQAYMPA